MGITVRAHRPTGCPGPPEPLFRVAVNFFCCKVNQSTKRCKMTKKRCKMRTKTTKRHKRTTKTCKNNLKVIQKEHKEMQNDDNHKTATKVLLLCRRSRGPFPRLCPLAHCFIICPWMSPFSFGQHALSSDKNNHLNMRRYI